MRYSQLLATLLCSTVFTVNGYAEGPTTTDSSVEPNPVKTIPADINMAQQPFEKSSYGPSTFSGFSLGLGVFNYSYEEVNDDDIFFMSVKAPDFGMRHFDLGLSGNAYMGNVYWHVNFTAFSGDTNYKSAKTGELKDTENSGFDFFAKVNHDINITSQATISPYYGFGFRELVDDKSGLQTTTGHTGYYRKSEYSYLPLGLDIYFQASSEWQLKAQVQWNSLITARQHSGSVINNQHSGWGTYLSLGGEYQLEAYRIGLKTFYHYWKIQDSDIQKGEVILGRTDSLLEPENETKETGITLTVAIPFSM